MKEEAICIKQQELQQSIQSCPVFFPGLLNNMAWTLQKTLRIIEKSAPLVVVIRKILTKSNVDPTQTKRAYVFFHFIGMESVMMSVYS